jgi:hypothetical protein
VAASWRRHGISLAKATLCSWRREDLFALIVT